MHYVRRMSLFSDGKTDERATSRRISRVTYQLLIAGIVVPVVFCVLGLLNR